MKIVLGLFAVLSSHLVFAENGMGFEQLSGGWMALTQQDDPFDKSKNKIFQLHKGDFVFRCRDISFKHYEHTYDSFAFGAKIKYVIDSKKPVDKSGWYSSYIGGSDMVNDDRYYSMSLYSEDKEALFRDKKLKMAGEFGSEGWTTRELALDGFQEAYNRMCN